MYVPKINKYKVIYEDSYTRVNYDKNPD